MNMKLLPVTVLLLFCIIAAHGQGTINFSNGAAGVNAPILCFDGVTRLAGTGFVVQLFAGPVGTPWDSLTPITPTATFGTDLNAGYFYGGVRTIPNVPTGSPAAFQVRVWTANFPTWDSAWNAYQAGDPTASLGVSGWPGPGLPTSTITSPNLGGGVTPPANLVGLSSFQLYDPLAGNCIPEPSTLLLALVGSTLEFGVWCLGFGLKRCDPRH